MGKGEHLGEFEQVVLLAVARRAHSYGAAVHEEIQETTGRDVTIATVYVTLSRLARKGYLSEAVELGDAERGGRPKKVFRLTGQGTEQLKQARLQLARLWEGLSFDPLGAEER